MTTIKLNSYYPHLTEHITLEVSDEIAVTLSIGGRLSVVKHISNQICVMYLGQMVEKCPKEELFVNPLHPYTKALLSAIPTTDIHNQRQRIPLKGEIKSPINPGQGCRFVSRCVYATEVCKQGTGLRELSPGHLVACSRAEEINNIH